MRYFKKIFDGLLLHNFRGMWKGFIEVFFFFNPKVEKNAIKFFPVQR